MSQLAPDLFSLLCYYDIQYSVSSRCDTPELLIPIRQLDKFKYLIPFINKKGYSVEQLWNMYVIHNNSGIILNTYFVAPNKTRINQCQEVL